LQPLVQFAGDRQPTLAELEQLHCQAHEECFIANSVKTIVTTRIRV
jgi:organic hydroperoxide reductase OsmC/OhrA